MSSIWLPGLVVLVVATAAGLLVGRRLGRRTPAEEDRRLRVADLERRRDELYERLRDLPEDGPQAGERAALELAAARVLRQLDEAGAAGGSAPDAKTAPAPDAPPVPPAAASRRSGLVGFAAGVVAMGVIALLVYWAGRAAAPGERPPPAPRGAGSAQGALPPDHPEVSTGLPAEVQTRLAALAAQVESDPEDIMARKELALTQLSAGLYMEAFQQAQELRDRRPNDPDALFVQGVVRVLMGGNVEAIELLDRVLADYPDHLQALFYRGVALYQSGEGDRAVETWQAGLAAAGGSHPEFERVLGMAAEAALGLAPSPAPQAAPQAAPPPASQAAPEAAPPPAPISSDGYPMVIELAEGAVAAPGAVVFVLLRPEAGGPPVAVRRIEGPRFPLRLVLGPGDSMMGAELPPAGRLGARLDGDGSASTRGPGDLAAEAPARLGEPLTLVLSPEGS